MSDIADLMAEHHVPGLSMATVRGDESPICTAFGVRDVDSGRPVDAATVFEAASLSKPIAAFAVMTLVRDGALSLDQPLARYVPQYMEHIPDAQAITARHVLSHTSGLPNWRSDAYPLRAYYPPGGRFSYSGEGFVYLQRAIERIYGDSFERIAERLIFEPLGMRNTSFVWQDRFLPNHAAPHTASGSRFEDGFAGKRAAAANAAGSLYTTAQDYARFLQAVLQACSLQDWLAPHANVFLNRLITLDVTPEPARDPDVAWALGWGVETASPLFFHWGDQKGYKAFTIASRETVKAMVVFTNGDAGLSFISKLVAPVFPGRRPSLLWLGYEAGTG